MSSLNNTNKSSEQHFSYQKDSNKDKDLNKDLHSNDLNMNKDLHNKDLNKPYSGSDSTHQVDSDKNKTEKTSITFERKKKNNDQDVDMNDKTTSQQKNTESKGFMDTVKENIGTVKDKVKEALSSGDNDKNVQNKEKNVGMGPEHIGSSGMSGTSSTQHQSGLGMSGSSSHYSSGQEHGQLHSGSGFSHEKQKGVLPATGVVHEERVVQEEKPITGVIYEKQGLVHEKPGTAHQQASMIHEKPAIGAIHHEKPAPGMAHEKPLPGAVRDNVTTDHIGLGAEHREVGYDKVVADKNKDLNDIHSGGIKTGTTGIGSSAGTTQGSAFKTTESK